jgi:hypothetical protein
MKEASKVGGRGPIMEGGKRGYRFTATETVERLLAGVKVVNEFGGGHPQPALFYPTIRGPLRATKGGCWGGI